MKKTFKKTCFAVILSLASWLGWQLMTSYSTQQSVKRVSSAGGIALHFLKDTAKLGTLNYLVAVALNVEFVYSVDMSFCHITRGILEDVCSFRKLKGLTLRNALLDRDVGLSSVGFLAELHELDLEGVSVDMSFVETISRLNSLDYLVLSKSRIPDGFLAKLALIKPSLHIRLIE